MRGSTVRAQTEAATTASSGPAPAPSGRWASLASGLLPPVAHERQARPLLATGSTPNVHEHPRVHHGTEGPPESEMVTAIVRGGRRPGISWHHAGARQASLPVASPFHPPEAPKGSRLPLPGGDDPNTPLVTTPLGRPSAHDGHNSLSCLDTSTAEWIHVALDPALRQLGIPAWLANELRRVATMPLPTGMQCSGRDRDGPIAVNAMTCATAGGIGAIPCPSDFTGRSP